ncbi:hypothetical protein LJR164_001622 [Phenylobacterium sp. LjRoot164]|uniref:terminase small subunit-like protein n=1 Tax=unclassified Phenylobacterium TaxID=2640670 RepID=UPI003ED0C6DB
MGRPSSFTPEIANEICERIGASESLRRICLDPHIPEVSTVIRWLAREDEPYVSFRAQYVHAREVQADTDADDIGDIGRRTLSGEYDPQAARVAIDALKWSAGKRAPKKYGDKVDLNHGGEVGLTVNIKRFTPDPTESGG